MTIFAQYCPNIKKSDSKKILPDLIIRKAKTADIPQLANIVFSRNGGDVRKYEKKFTQEISFIGNSRKQILFVAEIENKVVGFGRTRYFKPKPGSPENVVPEGWYLAGTIVDSGYRRIGVAKELTRARLQWLKRKTGEVYYFANAQNLASIDLHNKFGFIEVTRDFVFPGVTFRGGEGILFKAVISA